MLYACFFVFVAVPRRGASCDNDSDNDDAVRPVKFLSPQGREVLQYEKAYGVKNATLLSLKGFYLLLL